MSNGDDQEIKYTVGDRLTIQGTQKAVERLEKAFEELRKNITKDRKDTKDAISKKLSKPTKKGIAWFFSILGTFAMITGVLSQVL